MANHLFSKMWDTTFYDIYLKRWEENKSCGGNGTLQRVKFRIIRYYPPKGEESDTRGIHLNLCKVCVQMCDPVSWFLFVLSGLDTITRGIYRISGFFLHYFPMPSFQIALHFPFLFLLLLFSVELQPAHHLTAFTKYSVYRLPTIRNCLCESDVIY